MTRPIGYFVHHQGRGHAERAAAIVHALPADRPVTLFCARDDIFPILPPQARVVRIPSLFEPDGTAPAGLAALPTPTTLHCAPLGWTGITQAVAIISGWFAEARPALFITDVSAELAQLARIASVPCIPVIQHGDRDDPGHMAAYEGAVGILAPYSAALEQPGRPDWMTARLFHAGGLGVDVDAAQVDRRTARAELGLAEDADIVLVIAGGGGDGTPAPPITLGARGEPDSLWITIGDVANAWHDTPPGNLFHRGWVEDPARWIAAADRIVSSAGNTTVHMVLAAGSPWVVVPEWRYFAEQHWKARMLDHMGAAAACDHWPASAGAWAAAWARARRIDPAIQQALVCPDAAVRTAGWIERIIAQCWDTEPPAIAPVIVESVST